MCPPHKYMYTGSIQMKDTEFNLGDWTGINAFKFKCTGLDFKDVSDEESPEIVTNWGKWGYWHDYSKIDTHGPYLVCGGETSWNYHRGIDGLILNLCRSPTPIEKLEGHWTSLGAG